MRVRECGRKKNKKTLTNVDFDVKSGRVCVLRPRDGLWFCENTRHCSKDAAKHKNPHGWLSNFCRGGGVVFFVAEGKKKKQDKINTTRESVSLCWIEERIEGGRGEDNCDSLCVVLLGFVC